MLSGIRGMTTSQTITSARVFCACGLRATACLLSYHHEPRETAYPSIITITDSARKHTGYYTLAIHQEAAGSLQKHVQDAARILRQQLAGEAHGLQRLCMSRSGRSAGNSFSSSKDPILASATAKRPWACCVTVQNKDVAHMMQPAGISLLLQTRHRDHVTALTWH